MTDRRGFIKMLAAGTVVAASGAGVATIRRAAAGPSPLASIQGAARIDDRLYLLRGDPGDPFQVMEHPFIVGEPLGTGFDLGLQVESDGPAVIAPSSSEELWVLTTRRTGRSLGTYSFVLDDETAVALAAWGDDLPGQEAPIEGTGEIVEQTSTVIANLVSTRHSTVETVYELGQGETAFLEPVGVFNRGTQPYLAVTSSGRYGNEANLADEVLAFPVLPASRDDGVLATTGEVVLRDLGHGADRIAVAGSSTGSQDLVVSGERDFEIDLSGQRSERRLSATTTRPDISGAGRSTTKPRELLRHDRTPISGDDGYALTVVSEDLLIVDSI
jgi:hypothetical protein